MQVRASFGFAAFVPAWRKLPASGRFNLPITEDALQFCRLLPQTLSKKKMYGKRRSPWTILYLHCQLESNLEEIV